MHYSHPNPTNSLSIRLFFLGVGLLSLAATASAQILPIGTDQPVGVIVTRFEGTTNPYFSLADWETALNRRVNAYYTRATKGLTSFDFQMISNAVPGTDGVYALPYTYASTQNGLFGNGNDPVTIVRDVEEALARAGRDDPTIFDRFRRFMVVVNRPKREMAVPEYTYAVGPLTNHWIRASAMVISDPLAQWFQNGRTTLTDSDGDGVSDGNEEAFHLSDPFARDSDADGAEDGIEITLQTDPLDPASLPVIPDETIGVVVHELGHQLGLTDLYADGAFGIPNLYESWGLMANEAEGNFCALCRWFNGWVSTGRGLTNVVIGPPGLAARTIHLVPANTSQEGDGTAEIIRIQRPHFNDILIENRAISGLDAPRSGGSGRGPDYSMWKNLNGGLKGLPEFYRPGMLVSETEKEYIEKGFLYRYKFGQVPSSIRPFSGSGGDAEDVAILKAKVEGPAWIEFDWELRGDEQSRLGFHIDGVEQGGINREQSEGGQFEVGPGTHEIAFHHWKRLGPRAALGSANVNRLKFLKPAILLSPRHIAAFHGESVNLQVKIEKQLATTVSYTFEMVDGTNTLVVGAGSVSGETITHSYGPLNPAMTGTYGFRIQMDDHEFLSDTFDLTVVHPTDQPFTAAAGSAYFTFSAPGSFPWTLNGDGDAIRHGTGGEFGSEHELQAQIQGPGTIEFRSSLKRGELDFLDGSQPLDRLVSSSDEYVYGTNVWQIDDRLHLLRWRFKEVYSNLFGSVTLSDFKFTPLRRIQRHSDPDVYVNITEEFDLDVYLEPGTEEAGTTYRWHQDGTPLTNDPGHISGATTTRLMITGAMTSDAGSYHLVRTVPVIGEQLSSPSRVHVLDPHHPYEPVASDNIPMAGLNWSQEGLKTWRVNWNGDYGVPGHLEYFRTDFQSEIPGTTLHRAAFPEDTVFEDGLGLRVRHVGTTNGVMTVEVESDPIPPAADIVAHHGWIDSQENGFGTYLFPNAGEFGDPTGQGDFISYRTTVTWNGMVPNVSGSWYDHILRWRVVNQGEGDAANLHGKIIVFHGVVVLGFLENSVSALLNLPVPYERTVLNVSIDSLPAGEGAVVSAPVALRGPITAVLVMEPAGNERPPGNEAIFSGGLDFVNDIVPDNNSLSSVFLSNFVPHGSPYRDLEVPVRVFNPNEIPRMFTPTINFPFGQQWDAELIDPVTGSNKNHSVLGKFEHDDYTIRLTPPDLDELPPPSKVNPGPVSETVTAVMWMDLRDSIVPAGEIPIQMLFVHPSRISLIARETASNTYLLSGLLEQKSAPADGSVWVPVANAPVHLDISGVHGRHVVATAQTDASGSYQVTFGPLRPSDQVAHQVFAHAPPATDRDRADSGPEAVEIGPKIETYSNAVDAGQRPFGLILSKSTFRENVPTGTLIGQLAPGNEVSGLVDFSLVDSVEMNDNERFQIFGNELRTLAADFDYEARQTYSVRVRVTEEDLDSYEGVLNLTLTDDDSEDADGDGLTEQEEESAGSNDLVADSDRDGFSDGDEHGAGTSPINDTAPSSIWTPLLTEALSHVEAAHFNPFNGMVYAVRRKSTADGVYRLSFTNPPVRISQNAASAVTADPYSGGVFFSLESAGTVWRETSKGSESEWVATFLTDGASPVGLTAVPASHRGGVVRPGEGVVVDRAINGKVEVFKFSLTKANAVGGLYSGNGSLERPVDVAVNDSGIYVADSGAAGNGGVYRLDGFGQLVKWQPDLPAVHPRAISIDPLSQNLIVAAELAGRDVVLEVVPGSWKTRVLLYDVPTSRAGLDVSIDGRRLILSDPGAGLVRLYQRSLLALPVLSQVPDRAFAGQVLTLGGDRLDNATEVRVGGVQVRTILTNSAASLTVLLSATTLSGFVEVDTPGGTAFSGKRLRIAHAPTGIELTTAAIPELLPAGTPVGALRTIDPDPQDAFSYALVTNVLYPDNELFTIAGSSLLVATQLNAAVQTQFRLRVHSTDSDGLKVEDNLIFSLLSQPRLDTNTANQSVNLGDIVILRAPATGDGSLHYQWRHNGVLLPGVNGPSLTLPGVRLADQGDYDVIVGSLFGSATNRPIALLVSQAPQPIGNAQKVAVILVKYNGTEDHFFSPAQWVAALNSRVNGFYTNATKGQTSFQFDAITNPATGADGIYELGYTYASTEPDKSEYTLQDDPASLYRETSSAITLARIDHPELLEFGRFAIIVNRPKRGRAVSESFYSYPIGGTIKHVSTTVIDSPLAEWFFRLRADPGDDLDADGLSDSFEMNTTKTDETVPDSDGDGINDGIEVQLWSNPLDAGSLPEFPAESISLLVHELGHQLKAPDLYGDAGLGVPEHYGQWGVMATDSLQNFSAFTRLLSGWVRGGHGLRTIAVGSGGLTPTQFQIGPPLSSEAGGDTIEVLQIQRANFDDVLIENRILNGLDTARDGGPGRGPRSSFFSDNGGLKGLPQLYRPGMLVSQTDRNAAPENLTRHRSVIGQPVSRIRPFGDEQSTTKASLLTTRIDGPARLSFQWINEPAGADDDRNRMQVLVDDIPQARDDDNTDSWQTETINLGSGPHSVTLSHAKDFSPLASPGSARIAALQLIKPQVLYSPRSETVFVGEPIESAVYFRSGVTNNPQLTWQRWNGTTWDPLFITTITTNWHTQRVAAASTFLSGRYRVEIEGGPFVFHSDEFNWNIIDPATVPLRVAAGLAEIELATNNPSSWQVSGTTGRLISSGTGSVSEKTLQISAVGPGFIDFNWQITSGSLSVWRDGATIASQTVSSGTDAGSLRVPLESGTNELDWIFNRIGGFGFVALSNFNFTPAPRFRWVSWTPGVPLVLDTGATNNLQGWLDRNPPPGTTYQWYRNSGPLADQAGAVFGSASLNLQLLNVTTNDSAFFHLVVRHPDLPTHVSPRADLKVTDRFRPDYSVRPDTLRLGGLNWTNQGLSTWRYHQGGFPPAGATAANEGLESVLPGDLFFDAAYPPDTVFDDGRGLRVRHIGTDPNGVMTVEVEADELPAPPDVVVHHGWIDSDENGYDNYLFGAAGEFDDPSAQGDFISFRQSLSFTAADGFQSESTFDGHILRWRVVNRGASPAVNITGKMFIFHQLVWIGAEENSISSLTRLSGSIATGIYPVEIADLGPGESAVVSQPFNARGPVTAVLILNRVDGEIISTARVPLIGDFVDDVLPDNNSLSSAFLSSLIPHGSPYANLEFPVSAHNPNPFARLIVPQFSLPSGDWAGFVFDPLGGEKSYATVAAGQTEQFQIRIEPPRVEDLPPPDKDNPDPVTREVKIQALMDQHDTFVPIGEIPLQMFFVHPTRVSLAAAKITASSWLLSGVLERKTTLAENLSEWVPVDNGLVTLDVTAHSGEKVLRQVVTDSGGRFEVTHPLRDFSAAYAAIANARASADRDRSSSAPVHFGKPLSAVTDGISNGNAPYGIELSRSVIAENSEIGREVGTFTALQNAPSSWTYALVAGFGADDNAWFEIIGDRLQTTTNAFDYELRNQHFIRVRVTDAEGDDFEQPFVIDVADDNFEDTDGDGISEHLEEANRTSSRFADTDRDGFSDSEEATAGTDPLESEDFPLSKWVLADSVGLPQVESAHFNPADGNVYAIVRFGNRGVYRWDLTNSPFRWRGAIGTALTIDPRDGDIFMSNEDQGNVWRFTTAGSIQPWVRDFGAERANVVGISVVPAWYQGRLVDQGDAVVVDQGTDGGPEIYRFSTTAPDSYSVLHSDDGNLVNPVDVAIGRWGIFIVDSGFGLENSGIYRLDRGGRLTRISMPAGFVSPSAIAIDPLTQNLLVSLNAGTRSIFEINPDTGAHRELVTGLSFNLGRAGLDISQDGRSMLVSDTLKGRILRYRREYISPPVITRVEPEVVLDGGTITIIGENLEEVRQVRVGNRDIGQVLTNTATQIIAALRPATDSGIVTLENVGGIAESPRPLRIAHPPTAVMLSATRVREDHQTATTVGSLLTVDPDAEDRFSYELLPNTEYPDNDDFLIEDNRLVLRRDLDASVKARRDVGIRSTDRDGLTVDNLLSISLLRKPRITLEPLDTDAAEGDRVLLKVLATGDGDLHYQWSHEGQSLPGSDMATLAIDPAGASHNGSYLVSVNSLFGTASSRAAQLRVEAFGPVGAHLSSITRDQFGRVRLILDGVSSGRYRIRVSSDLRTWTTLREVEVPADSDSVTLIDTDAPQHQWRFYTFERIE